MIGDRQENLIYSAILL